MKICYITAETPWGKGETFILEEMLEIKKQGVNLVILPRNPSKEIFHKEAQSLLSNAVWLPLINFKIIIVCIYSFLTNLHTWKILFSIFRYSRNWHIMIKNLAVVPKGLYIAHLLQKEGIEHIHVHWGSTTATMAYIASQISNTPWSLTLHRWDIKEDNILREKIRLAKFVRCISEHGKNELLEIIGEEYKEKIKVIHMGVKVLSNLQETSENKKLFTLATPANLVEVKGHKYLIEACSILLKKGIKNFQCILYGRGPLRIRLENFIKERELTDYIKIPGVIPHEKLMGMYKNHEINAVVLPSITTNNGEHEGIPVALMEAMANGVPVISTNTGGIPELLSDGAGIIVEEKNVEHLANSLEKIIQNKELAEETGMRGYYKVKEEFNLDKNIKNLLRVIKKQ